MIRILHTADWHLGRILNQKSLLDDQKWIIEKSLLPLVDDAKPDLIVIAGDVYDRAIPPPEAVQLLDEVLSELVLSKKVPVLIVAGNHDSSDRLNFGSRLLSKAGLHVFGKARRSVTPILLKGGAVAVQPVPYFDPPEIRHDYQDESATSHQSAAAVVLREALAQLPENTIKVLVGHMFAQGGAVSESERQLAAGRSEDVGGAGQVSLETFAGWDFVALGHLHRPQAVSPLVSYSGSLLQYSFAEAPDKSVSIVDLQPGQAPVLTRRNLAPMRMLRTVRGNFDDLRVAKNDAGSKDDYMRIEYESNTIIPFVADRLREAYPNLMEVVRISTLPAGVMESGSLSISAASSLGIPQLFGHFYNYVRNEELTAVQIEAVENLAISAASANERGAK